MTPAAKVQLPLLAGVPELVAEPRPLPMPRKIKPPRDELAALRRRRKQEAEEREHAIDPVDVNGVVELVQASLGWSGEDLGNAMLDLPGHAKVALWRAGRRLVWFDGTASDLKRFDRHVAFIARGTSLDIETVRAIQGLSQLQEWLKRDLETFGEVEAVGLLRAALGSQQEDGP